MKSDISKCGIKDDSKKTMQHVLEETNDNRRNDDNYMNNVNNVTDQSSTGKQSNQSISQYSHYYIRKTTVILCPNSTQQNFTNHSLCCTIHKYTDDVKFTRPHRTHSTDAAYCDSYRT